MGRLCSCTLAPHRTGISRPWRTLFDPQLHTVQTCGPQSHAILTQSFLAQQVHLPCRAPGAPCENSSQVIPHQSFQMDKYREQTHPMQSIRSLGPSLTGKCSDTAGSWPVK